MTRKTRIQKLAAAAAVVGFSAVVGQSPLFNRSPRTLPDPHRVLFPSATGFGAPLADLGTIDTNNFADRLEEFAKADTPASDLPIFNNVSCVAGHSVPAPEGASPTLETRFGRLVDGHLDALAESGGSLWGLRARALSRDDRRVATVDAAIPARDGAATVRNRSMHLVPALHARLLQFLSP